MFYLLKFRLGVALLKVPFSVENISFKLVNLVHMMLSNIIPLSPAPSLCIRWVRDVGPLKHDIYNSCPLSTPTLAFWVL